MDFLTYQKNTTVDQGLLYHPQEDYYKISSEFPIVAVADGVTNIFQRDDSGGYPTFSDGESGPYKIAKLFCENIVDKLEQYHPEISKEKLQKAYKEVNQEIRSKNEKLLQLDSSHPDFSWKAFSATTAVGIIIENKLLYGFVHDCLVSVIGSDNSVQLKTVPARDRNGKPDEPAKLKREKEKTANKKEFRKKIRNNPEFINGDFAYSHRVINGQPGALAYLETGAVDLEDSDTIAICSDGFEPYFELSEFREILIETTGQEKLFEKLSNLTTNLLQENITVDDYSVIKKYGSERTLVLIKNIND